MPAFRLEMSFRGVRARSVAGAPTGGGRMSSRGSRVRGISGTCQVRSETKNPCPNPAAVEIRGIPFCGACAREQEAYFAIGEFTWEARDPGSDPTGKTFGETLEGIRRRRANGLAAARLLGFSGVDESGHLALTNSRAQQTRKLPAPR
jgi:hypothetical protein